MLDKLYIESLSRKSRDVLIARALNSDEISTGALTSPALTAAFEIKNVIFNNPATIVFWEDGTKTVVKRQPANKKSRLK